MSRYSSPACSARDSSKTREEEEKDPLTPRSKVKAMLAAFDDSESDTATSNVPKADNGVRTLNHSSNPILEPSYTTNQKISAGKVSYAVSEDDEEDDKVFIPRGKLAARLQRNKAAIDDSAVQKEPTDAYSRVRRQLLREPRTNVSVDEATAQSEESEKEIKPVRKLLMRRKKPTAKEVDSEASPVETPRRSNLSPKSPSPRGTPVARDPTTRPGLSNSPGLFVTPEKSTVSKERRPPPDAGSSDGTSDRGSEGKKSRLAELVARKKEERRVKEVAEQKKREERAAREAISSGASEVDSEKDVAADKRLTQLSKPTRKASKRALEEIARQNERLKQETQRINRNRQLTHQAVTKKRVTKESLLARFNFLPATSIKDDGPRLGSSSTQISSALQSDAEEAANVQTPSTSPLIPSQDRPKTSQAEGDWEHFKANQVQPIATTMPPVTNERTKPFAELSEDELPTLDELMTQPIYQSPKGKGKADENRSPKGKCKAIDYGPDSVQDDMDNVNFPLQCAHDSIGVTYNRLDKGKGKAIEAFEPASSPTKKKNKTVFTQPPIKVTPLLRAISSGGSDSDDLEIVDTTAKPKMPLKSRLEVLNRAPLSKTTDQRPLQNLRALAHLTSPSRQKGKSRASMTTSEMQQSLQMKARQQAARERADKIQDARDRGVIIQTADERERDQADLEDLLEKTRREVGELGRKEKEDAKRKGKENGEDELDSSEDEDYKDDEEEMVVVGSGSEEDEEGEGEEEMVAVGSGSEEDEKGKGEEDDDDDDDEENENSNGHLIKHEASEDDANEEDGTSGAEDDDLHIHKGQAGHDDPEDEDLLERTIPKHSRRNKLNRVIDEEDEIDLETPRKSSPRRPIVPHLPGSDDSPIGLTQAFAATMESNDTQTQIVEGQKEQQEFLAFVHGKAVPDFFIKDDVDLGGDSMVADSQAGRDETQGLGVDLDFVQSQVDHNTGQTQSRAPILATQTSDMPEPSQDVGFQVSSPAPERFVSLPPSTIETVLLAKESPIKDQVRKRGRLRLRKRLDDDESDFEDAQVTRIGPVNDFAISANAFDVLKRVSKSVPKESNFDKKTSNAKEMVEEQAQESEDEYAGLGGASDDESGGEMDEEVRKMVNDEEVKVDERKLAAFYAKNARASDEAAVSKLFKDITTGGLRRKRGAGDDLDLSDSEDEKQEARQRARRREFAKMRKALMADEKLGKMGVDPKKKAFLRAMEDWGGDEEEEVGLLEEPKGLEDAAEESQSQSQNQKSSIAAAGSEEIPGMQPREAARQTLPPNTTSTRPPLNPTATNPRRRPAVDDGLTFKRPSSLLQIRESLSVLLDDPAEGFEAQVLSSPPPQAEHIQHDDALSDDEPTSPTRAAREPTTDLSHRRPSKAAFIDRLSLKRESSSSLGHNSATNFAFQAPALGGPKFQPPSLLRRATSQLSAARENEHGISHATAYEAVEREAGDKGKIGGFKKGGGKGRTSVNWGGKGVREGRVAKGGAVVRRSVSGKSMLGGLLGGRQDSWE